MPAQHRPEIHVTAETGILNAPAGVLCDAGTWHIFYQFQPTPETPPRWGHILSDGDPFSWEECDDVLAPVGGELQLRAGSVVTTDNGVDLYFTSVTAAGSSIKLAQAHSLANTCEVSNDPSALDPMFTRAGDLLSNTGSHTNFRSPCVVRDWRDSTNRGEGYDGWLMLTLTGPGSRPVPVIATSSDGHDWSVQGNLEFDGDTKLADESVIVAPRIIRLRDEVDQKVYDVLLITLEQDGRDISGYLVGSLHGTTFEVTTGFTRLDHGYDFTRPRNTFFTPGTREDLNEEAIIFGLLNSAGRHDKPENHLSLEQSNWANALSLPRTVTLQGGILYQTPYRGVLDAIAATERARSWTGLCEIPQGSTLTAEISDAEGNTAFRITHAGNTLTIDRSMNPYHQGDKPMVAPLAEDDSDTLTIIIDGSTIEVFADGGQVAMSSRAYIKGSDPEITITTTGDARVENFHDTKHV